MRVLWILCLLIGSITCSPVVMDSGAYWYSGPGVSSDLGSSSSLPSPPKPSSDLPPPKGVSSSTGPGSSSSHGYPTFRDEVREYEVAYAASQDGSSAPSGSYSGGSSSYEFAVDPQGEVWSSGSATSYGGADENQEPVFSDVSDLEPVYSFSSHSRYQRGRALFAQTRYIPGPPVFPPLPASRPISKGPSQPSVPAKAPAKGGF